MAGTTGGLKFFEAIAGDEPGVVADVVVGAVVGVVEPVDDSVATVVGLAEEAPEVWGATDTNATTAMTAMVVTACQRRVQRPCRTAFTLEPPTFCTPLVAARRGRGAGGW